MKIQFLGVGAAMNTNKLGASILVNDKILFDACPGCSNMLLKCGIDLNNIEYVFISHLHGDHYFGLPFLLIEYMLLNRIKPLNIVAPIQLKHNILQLLKLAFPESNEKKMLSYSNPNFIESFTNKTIKFDEITIQLVKAIHSIDTYGFIINEHDTTVYYTSDTEIFDSFEEYIKKADIVIIDGTTIGFSLPGHINVDDIFELAKKYHEKIFYITHRSIYDIPQECPSNVCFPNDGDVYIL